MFLKQTLVIEISLRLIQKQMPAAHLLKKVLDTFAEDPVPLFLGDSSPVSSKITGDYHIQAYVSKWETATIVTP